MEYQHWEYKVILNQNWDNKINFQGIPNVKIRTALRQLKTESADYDKTDKE